MRCDQLPPNMFWILLRTLYSTLLLLTCATSASEDSCSSLIRTAPAVLEAHGSVSSLLLSDRFQSRQLDGAKLFAAAAVARKTVWMPEYRFTDPDKIPPDTDLYFYIVHSYGRVIGRTKEDAESTVRLSTFSDSQVFSGRFVRHVRDEHGVQDGILVRLRNAPNVDAILTLVPTKKMRRAGVFLKQHEWLKTFVMIRNRYSHEQPWPEFVKD